MSKAVVKIVRSASIARRDRILTSLAKTQAKGLTTLEIAGLIHCTETTVRTYIKVMRRAGTAIRVAGWTRRAVDGDGPWVPMYAVGTKPDAPRPKRLDRRTYNQRYRKAVKADADRLTAYQALKKRHRPRKIAKRDPLTAALFGDHHVGADNPRT